MPIINTQGRYPWGPGAKFSGNYVSKIALGDDAIQIRLDDADHDEFWLELEIPAELVDLWYHLLQVRKALPAQFTDDGEDIPADKCPTLHVGPLVEQYLLDQAVKDAHRRGGKDDQSQQPTTLGE